jgi:tryptophan-rich sensory protein
MSTLFVTVWSVLFIVISFAYMCVYWYKKEKQTHKEWSYRLKFGLIILVLMVPFVWDTFV